jgi:hypothetical protein
MVFLATPKIKISNNTLVPFRTGFVLGLLGIEIRLRTPFVKAKLLNIA